MQITISTLIAKAISYLNQILFLLMALAIVYFVWNVIKYFVRADSDKKEAGQYVMYSLVGFFIILSVWGIVAILQNTFGLGYTSSPTYSQIQNLVPGGGR